MLGVTASLAGGRLLAQAKGGTSAPSDHLAILATCLMPVLLAEGNVFRSRYWPGEATPLLLAGPMLLCGAVVTLPFAIWNEGNAVSLLWTVPDPPIITAAAILSFTFQYAAFFRLQQIAGPVYLSQIGSVAALACAFLAVALFGEPLPDGFAAAAILIALGILVFHLATPR